MAAAHLVQEGVFPATVKDKQVRINLIQP